ncbi:MAG: hypothetical protein R3E96_17145 [Planctomycetota bacterium]
MTDTLEHRGPNDAGYAVRGSMALGFRRLSIIDLAGGHQPLEHPDLPVVIVGNGGIYNFRELRAGLEARGARFSTGSDIETILHLYLEKGSGWWRIWSACSPSRSSTRAIPPARCSPWAATGWASSRSTTD